MMKRLTAPKFWPIQRKQGKFIVKPRPGPHNNEECMPLAVILRDVFKYAASIKEAKSILNSGMIKVDGKKRKDYKLPVGFMDVIAIGEESYRVLPGRKGFYFNKLDKSDKSEKSIKLLKIRNKTCVANKIQLNFHDGSNMLTDEKGYKTNDVVVYDFEKKEIRETLKLKEGSMIIITKGKSIGDVGKVEKVVVTKSSHQNMVVVKIGTRKISVPINFIFVVGEEKPVIALGERDA